MISGVVISVFVILVIIFVLFAVQRRNTVNRYRDLAAEIQSVETIKDTLPDANADMPQAEPAVDVPPETVLIVPELPEAVLTEPESTEHTILEKYVDLYLRNPEFFGWIKIDGTQIDYPVMRSFDDNDEYLHADFDGNYSYPGIPFADINSSYETDNILIYGHNMIDGTMFRSLIKYDKESYWKEHPTIMFSNLHEDFEYEVLAAFYDRVYRKSDTCFKFYQFIDAADQEEFDYAISQFKEKSIYDTGVDAVYGDKLITLVTCAYHVENGRFVVVARRK